MPTYGYPNRTGMERSTGGHRKKSQRTRSPEQKGEGISGRGRTQLFGHEALDTEHLGELYHEQGDREESEGRVYRNCMARKVGLGGIPSKTTTEALHGLEAGSHQTVATEPEDYHANAMAKSCEEEDVGEATVSADPQEEQEGKQ